MNSLLTDEEMYQATIIEWNSSHLRVAEAQVIKTLKAVGEWLANLTISGNAIANELRIVEGIAKLKRGEMPEEVKK